jgi:hypothetical protein
VALKNADYGWSWQLQLIFYRLFALLLNTLLHLITSLSACGWLAAEKERVSGLGLVISQRKVGKRRVLTFHSFTLMKSD